MSKQYTNCSKWETKLDTPCCILMPCADCNELRCVTDFYASKRGRKDALGILRGRLCKQCSSRRYKQSSAAQKLYYGAKRRALEKKIEFAIDPDDIIIPSHCPILGIELIPGISERDITRYAHAPSLDRIDNSKGYIPGNIFVISRRANVLKANSTEDEILAIFSYIVESKRTDFTGEHRERVFMHTPLLNKKEIMVYAMQYSNQVEDA